MFDNSTISLAKLLKDEPVATMVRDCHLSHVAKIPSLVPRRVVPCNLSHHLDAALAQPGVVGVIVPKAIKDAVPDHFGLALSETPVLAANSLHAALCAIPDFHWRSFKSDIDPSAQIHPTAYVATHDVIIGPGTVIHPGAVVLERTVIGAYCAIGPTTVIGTEAFEVDTSVSPYQILPQAGGVYLGDYVELQAGCTIVRATFGGFTRVGSESKFDCQVHLAHDCQVGERVRFAACAEISGRVEIGDECFLGPNCSISNGLTIGSGAHVTLGAVVVRDVAKGARVSGNFAVAHSRHIAHIKTIR